MGLFSGASRQFMIMRHLLAPLLAAEPPREEWPPLFLTAHDFRQRHRRCQATTSGTLAASITDEMPNGLSR
jgi:hypothetical protein